MNIAPINVHRKNNTAFGHNNPWADSPYDMNSKLTVAGTTLVGVAAGMACHAKFKGYSLSPKKMLKNIKNSYLLKQKFDDGPVLCMGAGSCIGGLLGGFIIDKDKNNRKSKYREAILQMTNISLPILFTVYLGKLGYKIGNKYWDKNRPKGLETFRTKLPEAILALSGLVGGVYSGNTLANKVNEKIFKQGKGRPVQVTDFSAHLDDFCVAGSQITDARPMYWLYRLVPLALLIAGNEVGNTTVANADS